MPVPTSTDERVNNDLPEDLINIYNNMCNNNNKKKNSNKSTTISNSTILNKRVSYASKLTSTAILFKPNVYLYHAIRVCLFISFPIILLQLNIISMPNTLFHFLAKVILYALLCEITGFSTMCGPLGSGQSVFTPLWFRTTTGTLKQPLFHFLPRKRNIIDILLFILFIMMIIYTLLYIDDDEETIIQYCNFILLNYIMLGIVDRTCYTGAMGAYYFPLLLCIGFGRYDDMSIQNRMFALKFVQTMHLFIPGIAKFGPWFFCVTPNMLGMCYLIPTNKLRGILYNNRKSDLSPSTLGFIIGYFGALTETLIPIVWMYFECNTTTTTTTTNNNNNSIIVEIAGLIALSMHIYIISMCCVGAVMEWNVINGIVSITLFSSNLVDKYIHINKWFIKKDNSIYEWTIIYWFLMFILIQMEFIYPLLAHIYPSKASNHFALRKYTGNHPYHCFLLKKEAAYKLNNIKCSTRFDKVKSTTSKKQKMEKSNNIDITTFLDATFLASLVRGRLNTKPLCGIFEEILDTTNTKWSDYRRIGTTLFLGQTMLDISYVDNELLNILRTECDFKKKELLSIHLNSFPTIKPITSNYISNWKVIDVGGDDSNNDNNKIINHGTVETDMYGKKVMLNIFDDDGNYKKQRVFDWNGEVI